MNLSPTLHMLSFGIVIICEEKEESIEFIRSVHTERWKALTFSVFFSQPIVISKTAFQRLSVKGFLLRCFAFMDL